MTRGRLYLAMLAAWVAITLTLTSIPNPQFGLTFQGWIPGRTMEFFDGVADVSGGTAGGFCSAVASSRLPSLLTRCDPHSSRAQD